MISIEGKTNFFEKRVGEYALATKDKRCRCFSFGEDFLIYFTFYNVWYNSNYI